MFQSLSERLGKTFKGLLGKNKLTKDNIQGSLREVEQALLEADCAHEVVEALSQQLETETVGLTISEGLSASQTFIKQVQAALVNIMGQSHQELSLKAQAPVVILLAGLQGSGKTTTAAKLARHLQEKHHKKVLLTSCDVYRPAAQLQLEVLVNSIGATYFTSSDTAPLQIAQKAYESAKKGHFDVLIVDTAGRLAIDEEMMVEIRALSDALTPHETLFVVDGTTGQDAARTAKKFHETLALTGVIVTKLDGDTRAGAILSIRHITGCPIKFVGMGEKTDALDLFHPDRMASRILGMGDVLSLIEQLEKNVDEKEAKKLAKKLETGKGFNFEDFRQQILQMQKMGGLANVLDKMPGMSAVPKQVRDKVNDKQMNRSLAIIQSMTIKERRHPEIIKGRRKMRIAQGSGTGVPEVNQLIKQFEDMQKMMKKMQQMGGLSALMQRLPKGIFPGGHQ